MDDYGVNHEEAYYFIRAGTECEVMSPRGGKWRKWTTQKPTTFQEVAGRSGEVLTFSRWGWRLRVLSRKVKHVPAGTPLWEETKAGLPPLGGGIVSPSEAEDVLSKLEAGWK